MTVPLANAQGKLNPLKSADPKEVIERYLNGETTAQIAESYGVTHQALSYHLIKHSEEHWKAVQLIKAHIRKEEADKELDCEKELRDPLALAYARERLKSAQWDLERVCRRIYGNDQGVTPVSPIQINIGISRDAAPQLTQSSITIEQVDRGNTE